MDLRLIVVRSDCIVGTALWSGQLVAILDLREWRIRRLGLCLIILEHYRLHFAVIGIYEREMTIGKESKLGKGKNKKWASGKRGGGRDGEIQ